MFYKAAVFYFFSICYLVILIRYLTCFFSVYACCRLKAKELILLSMKIVAVDSGAMDL